MKRMVASTCIIAGGIRSETKTVTGNDVGKIMIDINNFSSHSVENFDINLLQKEVDGGVITIGQIDEIEKYPEAKSIIISGLKQDTFEYFVSKYGNQFEAISFWKNKSVEDLSRLGSLKNIRYIHYYYNQRATDLWDMSGNEKLIGLAIYDFSKLHNIGKIKTSANLTNFQLGDAVTPGMIVQSLSPILDTKITHFEWWGKTVEDKDFSCLAKSSIEELDINPTQFTVEELADLLAQFPPSLKGSITRPYAKTGVQDKSGYHEYYHLCKRKRMCEKGKDDERFQKYLDEFCSLLDVKRRR